MAAIKITPSKTIEAPTMIINPSNYYTKVVIDSVVIFEIVVTNFLIVDIPMVLFDYSKMEVDFGNQKPTQQKIEKEDLTPTMMREFYNYIDWDAPSNARHRFIIGMSYNGFTFFGGTNYSYRKTISGDRIDFNNSGLSSNEIEKVEILSKDLIDSGLYYGNNKQYNERMYKNKMLLQVKCKKTFDFNKYSNIRLKIKLSNKLYKYVYGQPYEKPLVEINKFVIVYPNTFFVNLNDNMRSKIENSLNSKPDFFKEINIDKFEIKTYDNSRTYIVFDIPQFITTLCLYDNKENDYLCSILENLSFELYLDRIDTTPLDDSLTFGEEETKNNTDVISAPIFTNEDTTINGTSIYQKMADNVLDRYKNNGKVTAQMSVKYTSYNDINGNVVYNGIDGKYINVGDTIIPYILDEKGNEIPFRYNDEALNKPMEFIVMSSEFNYENSKTYISLEMQEK